MQIVFAEDTIYESGNHIASPHFGGNGAYRIL